MTDRDRLIEIFENAGTMAQFPGTMARILIENGVTFAKDTNAPSKWIPITERLPENAKLVAVCTKSKYYGTRKVATARCYDGEWHGQGGHWSNVTHWMPMPEPVVED